jgi:hypothetical protein
MIHLSFFFWHSFAFVQSAAYKRLVESSDGNSIVLVMDFASKLPSIQSFRELTTDFYEKESINDLVLVAIWKDKDGVKQHRYYDYFSEDPDHDSRYVRCGLLLVRWFDLMCLYSLAM